MNNTKTSKFYKFIKICDNFTDKVLLFCFLCFILIGLYGVYDSYMVYMNANDTSILKYKPTDDVLPDDKKISDDMVAWLTMNDTTIDYPVMQGETNNDYLNKNPYGEYSLSGAIFLDSNNSKNLMMDIHLYMVIIWKTKVCLAFWINIWIQRFWRNIRPENLL